MSGNLHVLVADVAESSADAANLIRCWGHRAEQSHDGLAAIEAARVFKPDLVLVDLGLPSLNGFGVAQRLRQSPDLQAASLVALVAESEAGQRLRGLKRAGFCDYLVKPIEPMSLLTLLVKTRDSLHKSQAKARLALEGAAQSKDLASASRETIRDYRQPVAVSQTALARKSPEVAAAAFPAASNDLVLLETLANKMLLDSEHAHIASKVLQAGEQSLAVEETRLYKQLQRRYLQPACKLCRYRIPSEEVISSWSNGGYCRLCADVVQ